MENNLTPIIKSQKVETYLVKLICPNCGAEMRKDDMVLTTNPVQYSYTCPSPWCGFHYTSYKSYPELQYKEVNDVTGD